MTHYDLAVIGSGSGNSIVGKEWEGKRVAIIDDSDRFGGTCLNRGCIPTKMLVHVADIAADAADAARLGITFAEPVIDWPAIRDRVFGRTDEISDSGLEWRDVRQDNVTVIRETVGFQDQRTLVTASGETIEADRIVIAAGSRPRPLLAAYAPDPRIHTSDTIMRIESLPESLLIVGGGAIAAEFAHVFSSFGVDVTVAVRGQRMLTSEDELVSECFTDLAEGRWTIERRARVAGIEAGDDGLVTSLEDGRRIASSLVLVAQGRIPNTDVLNAASHFDTDETDRIVVDAELRAMRGGQPVEGVWALGDITSEHQLKHVANHQARIVRANLGGEHRTDSLAPVPHAIFSSPQVASFGVRSQDAPDALVVTRQYGSTAFGWAMEDETSFVRLVVERDGRLLGAHIMGPQASILIQPLVTAVSGGRTIHQLARSQYWPHPALTEVIENALLDAEKELP